MGLGPPDAPRRSDNSYSRDCKQPNPREKGQKNSRVRAAGQGVTEVVAAVAGRVVVPERHPAETRAAVPTAAAFNADEALHPTSARQSFQLASIPG